MSMVFEQILTEGIAQLSYLIGDDSAGTAAVVDPRPDVEVYVQLARERGVTITHIFETHIHADFMSGSRELADRLRSAEIYVSGHEGAEYGFEHQEIADGDKFSFGSVIVKVVHTPSHTPEHVSYLLAEQGQEDIPWGVLTGDSLFVGSAGRPDLLGEKETEKLTSKLYSTLYDFYLKLDDSVMVYPCHGAGSACGADIGDRPQSTIGLERETNPFLHFEGKPDDFKEFVMGGTPHVPDHYPKLKKINSGGPPVMHGLPRIPGLTPKAFKEAVESGQNQLVDTRHMLSFGGGHIPGALNLGARAELSVWAGESLSYDKPILLVLDDDTDLDHVSALMMRTGFVDFAGYLVGGMTAWDNAGLPLQTIRQMSVHDVKNEKDGMQVLDVRSPSEWSSGHVPGAVHHHVAELAEISEEISKDKPVVTYCASGYRASLAASVLQRRGFQDVRSIPGSWQAWTHADYPVES